MLNPEPSLINADGVFSVEWRKWYLETHPGATVGLAHEIQKDRFFKMEEPPLKCDGNKRNPMWIAWYRVTKRVSTNVARRTWAHKVAGTYEPDKRIKAYTNATLNRQERKEAAMQKPRQETGDPYFLVDGKKVDLDRRLGQGRVTISTLLNTKLGRKALATVMLKGMNYESAVMEALSDVVPLKVCLAHNGDCSYDMAVNFFKYTGTEENWDRIKRNYALKLQILNGENYLINYRNILFDNEVYNEHPELF